MNNVSFKMNLFKIILIEKSNHWILDKDTHHEAALTCNRKVHDINSSLDNTYFENIIYLNRENNFEEYVACLGPKKWQEKQNKKIKIVLH